ncbi:REP element-mobilizing transposase RayT [Spirosomataceae bacterium TFI 002]|nr:REP element-mobilizing transposase RayT [Spirosomataceae bacterium TFI 002]
MPYVRVFIHFVWSTKHRIPHLQTPELRKAMWDHIKANGFNKGIFIDIVNGYSDHCHCLISLSSEQTMSKVMQLIKGESAFWINKQGLLKEKFEWQDEYWAVGVSESIIPKVRAYIARQEQHHQKKTWEEEFDDYLLKNGFEIIKDEK